MRNALRLTLAIGLLAPALALAQASVQLRLDLPVAMPQLVVVQPGIQVVPNIEEEVFYTGGWYWVRQDGGWYRSHSPRRGWFFVPPERVPPRLVHLPPGQYRHWHPAPPPPRAAPARFRPAPAGPRLEPARWGGDRGDPPGHGGRGDGRGHEGGGRGHEGGGHGHEGRGHHDRD